WSSDVCSSDLHQRGSLAPGPFSLLWVKDAGLCACRQGTVRPSAGTVAFSPSQHHFLPRLIWRLGVHDWPLTPLAICWIFPPELRKAATWASRDSLVSTAGCGLGCWVDFLTRMITPSQGMIATRA